MISFTNRVAVITGAGRGLGAGYARLLASRGAAVVVNDPGVASDGTATEATPAEEVAAEIRAAGGMAVAEHSSVATPEGGAAVVQKALDEFGRVDILINNAGILRDKAFHNLEWPNLDAVLDVHLRGAFYVTQPAFRAMRAQGYGRIVLTASNAGILGNFGQANYGAAKMGLVGLMNVLRHEGAKYDIKVNTVAPVARTRMTEEILGPAAARLDPEAVAPVVAYFCSAECAVNGDVWSVAGGNVSRFFIGRTAGYFKHPGGEGGLTVEDVAGHVDAIRAEAGYTVPGSVQEELQGMAPLLFS
ncbi:MAG: SDR family NAD(P)-dependent oxidoreductase [Acidimicrobiia bacterium]|nr:SDR family NAD(P)-dependent oxidoreductase [Acidimicrobiia bacterium]